MKDIQLTLCEPYFVDSGIMKDPGYRLRRLDNRGKRIYYRMLNGEPLIYTGVTTMIKQTMPTSPQLIEYYKKNGYEADDMAMDAADYGTYFHQEAQRLLVEGVYNFEDTEPSMREFCAKTKQTADAFMARNWDTFQRDMLAFARWVLDMNVKPIAIEQVLCSDKGGFAGAIDLICTMEIEIKGFNGEVYKSGPNKGKPKESKSVKQITSIVDFKTGRKGFWESYEIQLLAYKMLVEENYPDLKIDALYNWSPKDWRSNPDYNFKDQTNTRAQRKLPYLIELYKLDNNDAERKVMVIDGKINISSGDAGGYKELSYYEYVKSMNNGI